MYIITKNLPTVDENDTSFLIQDQSKDYVEALSQATFEEEKNEDYDRVRKVLNNDTIDSDFRDIIRNLLQINPYFRWSAAECLSCSVFDDIRTPDIEKSSTGKIKLECDRDGAFDFKSQ